MNHHRAWPITAVLFAGFVAASFAATARSEDRGAWFKGLKMPGTVIPCCDISDCRRTTADWRGGQWWATVDGKWTPIPPEKELSKRSIDGDAYVCASPNRYVYCFVKPDMVM